MRNQSRFLHHSPCPKCGSRDNLAVYDDGHTYCFGCGHHESKKRLEGESGVDTPETEEEIDTVYEDRLVATGVTDLTVPLLTKPRNVSMKERGLAAATIDRYQVWINTDPERDIEAVFPRMSIDNEHIANQIRYKGKKFKCQGDTRSAGLFGRQLFQAGGRTITVTEGYYDTLAAYQLTGSRYPNVGVMSASTAKKEIAGDFEYLNSFDKIVINFDSDEPGQKAAKAVAQLFHPGKVVVLSLQKAKDANDYLKNGWIKEYINEWFRAPVYLPDGLLLGNNPSLLDEIIQYKEPRSIPYPWSGLNNKTYGIRTSELVLITADTGVGKTSFVKEIEYLLLTNEELKADGFGVGFLHLEEPKRKTALGLMSIHNSKPYHFPDVTRTEEELREAYKEVLDTDRVVIWDHFGSNDIDVVLDKIRHMAALGCKYIMVDHLSIIVSDQSGDERKQLDEISTKIKTLTMNLDISCFCVIHINRQGQVRGSAGPEQVANVVIRLERDKKDLDEWRRNVTKVSVEKNREFGRTGPACYLFYNELTGRLEELDQDMAEIYEVGGSIAGHEFEAMPTSATPTAAY